MIGQRLKRSSSDATRACPGAFPRFQVGEFAIKIE